MRFQSTPLLTAASFAIALGMTPAAAETTLNTTISGSLSESKTSETESLMLIQSLSRKFNSKTSAGVAIIGSRAWSEAKASATKTGSDILGATAFSSYEISRGLFLSPSFGYVNGATEANLLSSTHIKVDQDTSAWTGSVALTQVIPFSSVVFGSVSLSTNELLPDSWTDFRVI